MRSALIAQLPAGDEEAAEWGAANWDARSLAADRWRDHPVLEEMRMACRIVAVTEKSRKEVRR